MKSIRNKSHRPIPVPLPRGKLLRLGPNQTGEIADKAADHPPLKKLIEAGDLEIVGDGPQADNRHLGSGPARASSQGHHPATTARKSGDR